MAEKNNALTTRGGRDPLSVLRQVTSDLDRVFDDWSARWPTFRHLAGHDVVAWSPRIDVYERDHRLVTRVDLPGVKKQDVAVEVADGYLTLSGERKRETEENKDSVYRAEREYGRFARTVPLPDGVKLEDVKATFNDGVLEVSIPLPPKASPAVHTIPIEEPAAAGKNAA